MEISRQGVDRDESEAKTDQGVVAKTKKKQCPLREVEEVNVVKH